LLKKHIDEDYEKYLELKEKPEGTMPMDTAVLVALISSSGITLSALITGIFNIWSQKTKNKSENLKATIKLKGKDGLEVEAPANMKAEELDELIKKAEKMTPLKYIALKED